MSFFGSSLHQFLLGDEQPLLQSKRDRGSLYRVHSALPKRSHIASAAHAHAASSMKQCLPTRGIHLSLFHESLEGVGIGTSPQTEYQHGAGI